MTVIFAPDYESMKSKLLNEKMEWILKAAHWNTENAKRIAELEAENAELKRQVASLASAAGEKERE